MEALLSIPGVRLASLDDEIGVAVAEIDLSLVEKVRRKNAYATAQKAHVVINQQFPLSMQKAFCQQWMVYWSFSHG